MNDKQITDLIKTFDDSKLSDLKIEKKDFSISLSRQITSSVPVVSVPVEVVATNTTDTTDTTSTSSTNDNALYVKSPMVGTFYSASNPEAKPFAGIGDVIKKGSAIGIIEAMKIMNEIDAPYDMKVIDILVQNGGAVEFDMPLFQVEKV